MHLNASSFRIKECVNMVKSCNNIEPPNGLYEKIINRIHKERRLLTIRKRIFIFSVGLLGSLTAFWPAYRAVKIEFLQSGFFQFASLVFSDFSIIAAHWQNFTLVLLEVLPIMSLIIFLAVLFTLFESAKYLTKNIRTALAIN